MTLSPGASILWAQAEEIFPAVRGNKLTVRVVLHITVTPLESLSGHIIMRNLTTTTLLLVLGLLPGMAPAQEIVPLKPEEAFRYAAVDTGTAIEVDWALEDGYYLYQQKLSFASGSSDIVFGNIELPTGLHHERLCILPQGQRVTFDVRDSRRQR